MTKAYFAGINTKRIAEAAEGHPVLVSFASMLDSHKGVIEREVLPRLQAGVYDSSILDSGAFTELSERAKSAKKLAKTLDIPVDELTADHWQIAKADAFKRFNVSIDAYIAFCLEYGSLFTSIVTLDDIQGDLAVTWNNTKAMLDAGLDPVVVFHGREPFDVLRHYVSKFKRVGLGFFREPSGKRVVISKDQGDGLNPDQWLSKALDICEEAGVEVHGFGMTRYALKRGHSRLTTSDSTTWISEYLALRKRSATGSDRLGSGNAADLLEPFDDSELMRLSMASYTMSGADDEIVALTEDCRGQANTVLNRFNSTELFTLLEGFGAEYNATRVAA